MEEQPKTVYDAYLRPVVRYFVELGEVFALTVFFYVAAQQTHSFILDAFSFVMFLVTGAVAGLPLGFAGRHVDRIKTKDLRVALLITIPIGAVMAFVCLMIGQELSQLVRELGNIQLR